MTEEKGGADMELLRRAALRDKEALTEIYQRYRVDMLAAARNRLRHGDQIQEKAEDCYHDAFVTLLSRDVLLHLSRRENVYFKAYLKRAVINKCITLMQGENSDPLGAFNKRRLNTPQPDGEDTAAIPDWLEGILRSSLAHTALSEQEVDVERERIKIIFEGCLDRLNPESRAVLQHCSTLVKELGEWPSYRQLGLTLGVSHHTAKNRLGKATTALKRVLFAEFPDAYEDLEEMCHD